MVGVARREAQLGRNGQVRVSRPRERDTGETHVINALFVMSTDVELATESETSALHEFSLYSFEEDPVFQVWF